ncbi:hypothetical protein GQ607_015348 [Colletotrichum asianum]|uniref:Uncharacterized protein n=1 Tax=Colletotrichum asianum TaxID=702518 RepID=A0A8H3ZKX3_9PEZI|nr:hypothetical protein GQ607_015348 [Colletotrichum asianum]
MEKRLQVLLGPSAAVTAASPAHALSLANNAVVAAGSDLSQSLSFAAFWHDFGLTFVTRRKFTMLSFLCPGGRPASKTSDTQLNSRRATIPLLPECHPMLACGLAALRPGRCWPQELELAHTHRPGAPQTPRENVPGGVPSAARRRGRTPPIEACTAPS